MKLPDKLAARRDELAAQYARDKGDDCLCQRTNPGTPVGEHIHCFCGCDLHEAHQAGFNFGAAEVMAMAEKLVEALGDLYECELAEWGIQDFEVEANDSSSLGNAKGALAEWKAWKSEE